MQILPLQALPNQMLTILLAKQLVKLSIYTMVDGNMYMDVFVNHVAIITGVICQNQNRIVRDAYLGFIGDLAFNDTLGSDDPVYSGLGTRYQLFYLSASDVAAL
jgi:hypothetical protein